MSGGKLIISHSVINHYRRSYTRLLSRIPNPNMVMMKMICVKRTDHIFKFCCKCSNYI